MERAHIFLMTLQTVCCTSAWLKIRVILRKVAVVVRAKIKLHKLSQLTDCSRHMAIEAKAAEVDHRNTSVRVKRHTWLVTPKVWILVEVPVCTYRIVLTIVVPFLSMKSLPDLIKSIVVLDVLVCLMK